MVASASISASVLSSMKVSLPSMAKRTWPAAVNPALLMKVKA
jgi:hypothetical protein